MAMKQTIDAYDLLEAAAIDGVQVAAFLRTRGVDHLEVQTLKGPAVSTDVIRIHIRGTDGKSTGGRVPTLGIVGQLGGIGARPARIGLVSDADGAIAAIAAALKLAHLARHGDALPGDVLITTHICPRAPTVPRERVEFMMAPVPLPRLIRHVVDPEMDAILSLDTTRGNRILNYRGLAVTPTVKQGYVLRVSEGLLDLVQAVTGRPPVVLPITTQDITPYGNQLFHLNSFMQPATVTDAPVVGIAFGAETVVSGSATGVTRVVDVEEAVRLCLEVAKEVGSERLHLYDSAEFERLQLLYGTMTHLQAPQPWAADAWESQAEPADIA